MSQLTLEIPESLAWRLEGLAAKQKKSLEQLALEQLSSLLEPSVESLADEEATLIQATQARLPAADERRLQQLIAKSERGTLSPRELEEYRALAQQAEQLNGVRVEALAELARRRGRPAHVVMREIGWEGRGDGA
jgi:hypothetical protein